MQGRSHTLQNAHFFKEIFNNLQGRLILISVLYSLQFNDERKKVDILVYSG